MKVLSWYMIENSSRYERCIEHNCMGELMGNTHIQVNFLSSFSNLKKPV